MIERLTQQPSTQHITIHPTTHRVLWPFLHPDDVNPFHTALSAAILQAPGQRIGSRLRSPQHPSGYLTVDVALRYGQQGVVLFMRPEPAALVGLVGGGPAQAQAMRMGQQPPPPQAAPPAAPLAYAALAMQQHQHQPLQQAAYLRAPPPPSPAPSTSSSSSSPGRSRSAAKGRPS
jgi:hypothetical protein